MMKWPFSAGMIRSISNERNSRPFLALVGTSGQHQTPNMETVRVTYSDSQLALYLAHGRAKPGFHGPNCTECNLLRLKETTYRDIQLSEGLTLAVIKLGVWSSGSINFGNNKH